MITNSQIGNNSLLFFRVIIKPASMNGHMIPKDNTRIIFAVKVESDVGQNLKNSINLEVVSIMKCPGSASTFFIPSTNNRLVISAFTAEEIQHQGSV